MESKFIVVYTSVGILSGRQIGEKVEVNDPSDAKRLVDSGLIRKATAEELASWDEDESDEGGDIDGASDSDGDTDPNTD